MWRILIPFPISQKDTTKLSFEMSEDINRFGILHAKALNARVSGISLLDVGHFRVDHFTRKSGLRSDHFIRQRLETDGSPLLAVKLPQVVIGMHISLVADLPGGHLPEKRMNKAGICIMLILFNQINPFRFFGGNISIGADS